MTLQGGFQSEMNRREAAQILGVRESAAEVSRSLCPLSHQVRRAGQLGMTWTAYGPLWAFSCAAPLD